MKEWLLISIPLPGIYKGSSECLIQVADPASLLGADSKGTMISVRQLILSLLAMLTASGVLAVFLGNPEFVGSQALIIRAAILDSAILLVLTAIYPLAPVFVKRPAIYGFVVCLPALLPAIFYFCWLLPQHGSGEIQGEQLNSALITDASSNGLVEVGFAYPIYTPLITLRNTGLFTEYVNVFLRVTDANDGSALFRAVRAEVPGSGLSVESSVRGMLSNNGDYRFNPLALPPAKTVQGKMVFIISSLDDGTSFTDALSSAFKAEFEIRNPASGALITSFPLDRL